jgi:hypothetical protein
MDANSIRHLICEMIIKLVATQDKKAEKRIQLKMIIDYINAHLDSKELK